MSLWWGQRSGWRCYHSRFLLPVWTSWHVSFTNTHFLSLQDPVPVPPGHRRLLGCQSGTQKHHIGEPARWGVCRNTNTQKSQHVVTSCLQRTDLHPTLQNKGTHQSSGTKYRVSICLYESSLVPYLVSGGKTVWLNPLVVMRGNTHGWGSRFLHDTGAFSTLQSFICSLFFYLSFQSLFLLLWLKLHRRHSVIWG